MPDGGSGAQIRAVLMDLDGTIADSHDLIYTCLDRALRELADLVVSREAWERAYCGMPLHEVYAAAFAAAGRATPNEALSAALTDRYREWQRELEPTVRAFPGVPAALSELRSRGVALAVVTTKHEASALRTIAHLDITGLFDAVVCGNHCANYKPHPEPFERALSLLELAGTPAAAMAVGDSRFDVDGGRAAGVRTAGALWGALDRHALEAAAPDHLLERPEQLVALVDGSAMG